MSTAPSHKSRLSRHWTLHMPYRAPFENMLAVPDDETWKARLREFFDSNGYRIPPVQHADAGPSSVVVPEDDSDYPPSLHRPNFVSGTRHDGQCVCIKRVATPRKELAVLDQLNTEVLRGYPTNHCCPLFDVLEDPDDSIVSFMVMPYLHPLDTRQFVTIQDAIDFTNQMLAFMHKRRLTHRDCSRHNVMCLSPVNGPMAGPTPNSVTGPRHLQRPLSRFDSHTTKRFYFIDFAESKALRAQRYGHAKPLANEIHTKNVRVPELQDCSLYDPFALDIYLIGNMFREVLLDRQQYSNVEFLAPLVKAMTMVLPEARPSAEEALTFWYCLLSHLPAPSWSRKLRVRKESLAHSLVRKARSSKLGQRLSKFTIPRYRIIIPNWIVLPILRCIRFFRMDDRGIRLP